MGARALDARDSLVAADALGFVPPVLEDVDALASPRAEQARSSAAVGVVPAEVSAVKHVDPEGPPLASLPLALFAPKSSEAEDGWVPQLVPRLASVGRPGVTSAVEHVEAFVGSSAEPNPSTAPANEPVAAAIALARTRESEVETLDRLASAPADGPDDVGVGVDPSGADGSGSDALALVGTVARVPGAVADVEPCEDVPGWAVFELEAVIGSVEATVAGPTLPGVADADPPAVEPLGSGWMTGCAESAGPSASAPSPVTFSSATTAMISSSFLIL